MVIYTTAWCGYCHRLKRQLERAAVPFREVDIENDPAAADFVMSVNEGNAVVPTVVFADGSVSTNPSLADVQARLAA
jgi:mycoredoxin